MNVQSDYIRFGAIINCLLRSTSDKGDQAYSIAKALPD
jgi:hypothetical protein